MPSSKEMIRLAADVVVVSILVVVVVVAVVVVVVAVLFLPSSCIEPFLIEYKIIWFLRYFIDD